jgi:hypothetical protein
MISLVAIHVLTGGGMIYAFALGLQAFKQSKGQQGEYAHTLRLLGLSLCEPLVNSTIILLMVSVVSLLWHADAGAILSLPMAVLLLLPAVGLRFRISFYRKKCQQLLAWGIARWICSAIILAMLFFPSGMMLVMVVAGVGLLWFFIVWGRDELRGPLACATPGGHYTARGTWIPATSPHQPALAAAVQAARLAPAQPVVPVAAPSPPLLAPVPGLPDDDTTPPILCPVCHAATRLSDNGCFGCGLVFQSRVPSALLHLPDYEVLRPLGSGGMSSVYLARLRGTNDNLCVLKTLASVERITDLQWRAEAAQCLRQEAALLQQLDHPHICRVHNWVHGAQVDFLVLEYVPGLTLEQRLTRADGQGNLLPGAPLPLHEALAHAISVAGVLEYLADLPQPLIHHDIKPANLIVRPDDRRLVLVDFGGAALDTPATAQTPRQENYGTPGYAAPEQYTGLSTPASDIFGLGATLYHLLTNDDPGDHPLEFPQLATLSPTVAEVLRPALERDPAARPDAQHFRTALQHLQAW